MSDYAKILKAAPAGHEFYGNQYVGGGSGDAHVPAGFKLTGDANGTTTHEGALMNAKQTEAYMSKMTKAGYTFQHVGTGIDFQHPQGQTVHLRSFAGSGPETASQVITYKPGAASSLGFTNGANKYGPVVRNHQQELQSFNWHTRTMAQMRDKPDEALRFINKDANEAARLGEQMGSRNSGKYRDEALYAAMELKRRGK